MSRDDDNVMYLIFREDLPMSPGKIAAQAGHAVQLMIENLQLVFGNYEPQHMQRARRYSAWQHGGITKVALRVKDLSALNDLRVVLAKEGVWARIVVDEGHTEVPPGSVTCMSIEPREKAWMRQFVGKLRLL